MSFVGVRGAFLDYTDDPFYVEEGPRFTPDGLLVLNEATGTIVAFGPFAAVAPAHEGILIHHYPDRLIMPGFIDTHVHHVQARVTGAFGLHKPEWLGEYIFPEEMHCSEPEYAREIASWFLDTMLRVGTTTVQSFSMPAKVSTEALFEEASRRNMRVIAGVTGVDAPATAPPGYTRTPQEFYDDSRELYERWHGNGRNLYAVTPRYAPGASPELLAKAGQLYRELPGVYMNTHIAEVPVDLDTVRSKHPNVTDYTSVFESHGLMGPRCTFGHGIWLTDSEFERFSRSGSAISFCPASNLFLGSGLFKLRQAKSAELPVRVGLGTDAAGGNYFSLLRVLNDAYKVAMLQDYPVSGLRCMYLATLGGAHALYLDDKLGSFEPGKEADFVVLDYMATPDMTARNRTAAIAGMDDLEFKVFGMIALGDDRCIAETWVAGKRLYTRA